MPEPTNEVEPGRVRGSRLLPGLLIGAIMLLIAIAVVSFH